MEKRNEMKNAFYKTKKWLTPEQKRFLKYVRDEHNSIGFVAVNKQLQQNYFTVDQYGRRCENFMAFLQSWKDYCNGTRRQWNRYGKPIKYLK